ncbi:MAG: hypothetical protein L0387_00005, partial [Acidobacteria bacterium]|nr:hypothetical protein [Acidobacteriota bacterium]
QRDRRGIEVGGVGGAPSAATATSRLLAAKIFIFVLDIGYDGDVLTIGVMGWKMYRSDVVKWTGECREWVCGEKFHAVLCDPPYGLEFMGQEWDRLDTRQPGDERFTVGTGPFGRAKVRHGSGESYGGSAAEGMQQWHRKWAEAVLKVVYPGAVMLCFGGTRTWHRLVCGLEDAGWEVVDTLMYLHGQGFPKAQGVEGVSAGWKTPALKPAWEPILLARAPRQGKSYDQLVLEDGSGLLNVDGARVKGPEFQLPRTVIEGRVVSRVRRTPHTVAVGTEQNSAGRYPANVVLECICERVEVVDAPVYGDVSGAEPSSVVPRSSVAHGEIKERTSFEAYRGKALRHTDPDCPAAMLDQQAGPSAITGERSERSREAAVEGTDWYVNNHLSREYPNEVGGPSRFFYCPKADRDEREAGLERFEVSGRMTPMAGRGQPGLKCKLCGKWKHSGNPCVCPEPEFEQSKFQRPPLRNHHPTVKPIDLTRWLATLLLPPPGRTRRLLVPFAGSGSEMIGALQAGWDEVVGVEQNAEYCRIAEARVKYWKSVGVQLPLLGAK